MTNLLAIFLLIRTIAACDPTSFVLPLMRSDTRCLDSSSDSLRPYYFDKDFELALKPETNYTVKANFEQQITNYTNCLNDSIALILTDIPCSQYSKYPDLQELFGDLNRTIKWLTNLRVVEVRRLLEEIGRLVAGLFVVRDVRRRSTAVF
ncbi:hypothetical protein M3Y95_01228900 [Aphelenchoides besseyi]|nr:hypothetical protein M3Y95_01228900 [Aphelenchoides besseyi]